MVKPICILKIGDPATNGLLLEKSYKGMLRYVMASPERLQPPALTYPVEIGPVASDHRCLDFQK